ncbi:MAG: GH39 family glycosyl hydrolase [Novosphingobium sp.]
MDRRHFLAASAATAASAAAPAFAAATASETIDVTIRSREEVGPLPHVWEECVGSDRAAITLRESWRRDMARGKAELGIKRVRFHGIFADELGVNTRTIQRMRDNTPNFKNVAEVYDGVVALGLQPSVELSFMPSNLASGRSQFGFYNANTSPPKSYDEWGAFIRQFVLFLVNRYGINEVAKWPLEVWNEPNLGVFWSGKQADYFQLYKSAAAAIKSIDPRLQVGGPATSATDWLPEFLEFAATENAPVDFVTTHIYPGDNQEKLFGPGPKRPIPQVIPDGLVAARRKVNASKLGANGKLPLYVNEWSSDSPAIICHVLSVAIEQVQMMSHWVLSGAYEELGPTDYMFQEGSMGWSLMLGEVPRPNYNTYRLLHALGHRRLASTGPALASKRADGSLAAMVWNLADVDQPGGIPGAVPTRNIRSGSAKRISVQIPDMRAGQPVKVRFVDQERGSPIPAWKAMGSPKIPTPQQVVALRSAAQIAAPRIMRLDRDRKLTLDLPMEGVALIET